MSGFVSDCSCEGFYPVGNFREVEMVNWTALLGLVHGVAVRKTSRHWFVHVECLYGQNLGELFGLAKNLGTRVGLLTLWVLVF